MADSMASSISCPICLDLLKDPVTTSCGHSYCMGCIKAYWDQDDQKGVYSCPLCKESFVPRPVLRKNNLLAELVEALKKTGLEDSPPHHLYAGPGDVVCDVCTGRKRKALKSCLVCLASYCETHLHPHHNSAALKKHKLVEASSQLQEKICSRHDKVLELFCINDRQCICYLCSIYEHKDHKTVQVAAERKDKQKRVMQNLQKLNQELQEKEKMLNEVHQSITSLKHNAQTAEEDSERIFTQLIAYIERRRSEVKEVILSQRRAAVSEAEGQVEGFKKVIAELRRRATELGELSSIEDDIHFLQSLQALPRRAYVPSVSVPKPQVFGDWKESVCLLRGKIEVVLAGEWPNTAPIVARDEVAAISSEAESEVVEEDVVVVEEAETGVVEEEVVEDVSAEEVLSRDQVILARAEVIAAQRSQPVNEVENWPQLPVRKPENKPEQNQPSNQPIWASVISNRPPEVQNPCAPPRSPARGPRAGYREFNSDRSPRRPTVRHPDNQQIFVGGLPDIISESALEDYFGRYGPVLEVALFEGTVVPHTAYRLPDYGFITFANADTVQKILKARPHVIDLDDAGRFPIKVDKKIRSQRERNQSDGCTARDEWQSPHVVHVVQQNLGGRWKGLGSST